jgi:hypothetical protein
MGGWVGASRLPCLMNVETQTGAKEERVEG